jgi:alpha,alpha-trehalase
MKMKVVIFDLDGVITKTAKVHSRAWKLVFDEYLNQVAKRDGSEFKEFTYQDYLKYVDGKPRYDGVASFLGSRDINLDRGQPSDSPEQETVCGVGNRKNIKFREIVKKDGVEIYPEAIRLVKELKSKDIRVGVASSSKNCKYLLQAAGIEDLFQVRIDGEVSAKLNLQGKPEGDIFTTAAYKLDSKPAEGVVIEDASSGVKAGRNGGFNFVLGVARKQNEATLLQCGADMVTDSLKHVSYSVLEKWFQKTAVDLFESWQDKDLVKDNLKQYFDKEPIKVNPFYLRTSKEALKSSAKTVFFLDYDGTLTPIVDRPEQAKLNPQMRQVIEELAQKFTVAVVSGRMREDVENLVAINGIFYAGSHGFDIKGPDFSLIQPEAEKIIPLIDKMIKYFHSQLDDIKGVIIEEKKFSLAVHYRLVEPIHWEKIKELVYQKVDNEPRLRLLEGKKVFEIMPAVDWNKGKAVRWIMRALKLDWQDNNIIYMGDDTTDEDAFRVIRGRGVGILVSESHRPTAADFQLRTPGQVKDFFEKTIKDS